MKKLPYSLLWLICSNKFYKFLSSHIEFKCTLRRDSEIKPLIFYITLLKLQKNLFLLNGSTPVSLLSKIKHIKLYTNLWIEVEYL